MKILVLNPPFYPKFSRSSRSPAVTKSGTIYYPIWLAYATGYLESNGYEVKLYDAPAKSATTDDVKKICEEFKPDLIISDTSTPSIDSDLSVAKEIKSEFPEIKYCLVGTHATAMAEDIISENSAIDFVARREYEETTLEIVKYLEGVVLLENIKGLTYRVLDKVISNEDRPFIKDLDKLPLLADVYEKHLDIEDYFYAHVSYPTVSIFASRGCPSRCNYCVYSQVLFGKDFRSRSAKNLFREMQLIQEKFPAVKEVLIDDDNFSVDENNVKDFCEMMISSNIKLKWIVQARVTLNIDVMRLMKKAGCILIVAGFESGNQQILDNVNKGITLEMSRTFMKNAKKVGMRVHGCFMAGNKGETKETLMQTLEFAKTLPLDTVQFFPLMVYPGTEAYQWAKENSFIAADKFSDWLTDEGLHNCVLSTNELSALELVNFCDYARREYYLRPSYIMKKGLQMLTNKKDFVRTLKAFKVFKKHLMKKVDFDGK